MRVVATLLVLASVASSRAFAQSATLEVTPSGTAPAGSTVTVRWSGPNGRGDYLTVTRKGADVFAYLDYKQTSEGSTTVNPVSLVLPAEPGAYEIRYVTGAARRVLAAVPYQVTAITATVEGPARVAPDARFDVAWLGPNNRGDWVTIVAAGAAPPAYGSYVDARNGRVDEKTGRSVATLRAPTKPGQYELRYVQRGTVVIGTRAIEVTSAASTSAVIVDAGAASASVTTGAVLSPTAGFGTVAGAGATTATVAPASAPAPTTPVTQAVVSPGSTTTAVDRLSTGRVLGTLTEAKPVTPGGPPVSGLQVRLNSPSEASLRWSCVQGSTGYEVFSAMNGGEPVKITRTPLNPNCAQDLTQVNPALLQPGSTPATTYSTGFSQGDLTPANNYTYFVRALYGSGGPADSAPVTVRPLFPAPGFEARATTNPGQVTIYFQWANVNIHYPTGYVISRKLAGESTFRQLATVPYDGQQNVYNDNGVPVGSHEYLVEAVDGEKGKPATVTTGALSLWQAWTQNIVIVDLGFSGVWPGGTVRVLSAPAATGPFTDITAGGRLSDQHWLGVAPFGSNLHYKVVVTYPNGTTYQAVAQVAVPQASNIGLTAEDAGGGTRMKWNCEPDVARYELLRRVGGSGPFTPVGPYAFTVYPQPGQLGGAPTCGYNDTTVPLGNNVEYVVIGFSSKQNGDKAIRAAGTMVFIKTWP
jgi:hypothetical protein